jgi:RNA polymerase sigma-70 factor (ECF subfamily)
VALQGEGALAGYFLLPATLAQFEWVLGDHARAVAWFERALSLPCSEPEQRLLQRRLAACRRGEVAPVW